MCSSISLDNSIRGKSVANEVRVGTYTNRGFRFVGIDVLSKLFDYWDDKLEMKYTE